MFVEPAKHRHSEARRAGMFVEPAKHRHSKARRVGMFVEPAKHRHSKARRAAMFAEPASYQTCEVLKTSQVLSDACSGNPLHFLKILTSKPGPPASASPDDAAAGLVQDRFPHRERQGDRNRVFGEKPGFLHGNLRGSDQSLMPATTCKI